MDPIGANSSQPKPTNLLTARQVAELLQWNPYTIIKKAEKGELPGFKLGREWRFRQEDIVAWIEEEKEQPMSKILVIDDNQLVSLMLRESLSNEGYEVALAADANQGYAQAIEFHPDLILLDVQLPDVVGFDLIRIIKNRDDLRHIPIMMITGTAHRSEEKVKGFQLGADDYVLKPFDMPELLERIKVLLRRSQKAPAPLRVEGEDGGGNRPVSSSPLSSPTEEGGNAVAALSIREAVAQLLFDPFGFPEKALLPAMAMPCLMALAALALTGLGLAAGQTVKPAVAGLGIAGGWIILTMSLVVACSVSGIPCTWRDGGRLLGLASLPILLKMVGALVSTFWTTLSPFYFTSSLALFWPSAPFLAYRTDIFEIWSLILLWLLIRKRSGATPRRAWIVVGVVWLVFCVLAAGMSRVGGLP